MKHQDSTSKVDFFKGKICKGSRLHGTGDVESKFEDIKVRTRKGEPKAPIVVDEFNRFQNKRKWRSGLQFRNVVILCKQWQKHGRKHKTNNVIIRQNRERGIKNSWRRNSMKWQQRCRAALC